MITNPEDTGLYNPRIKEFVDAVHGVGGLCFCDQANANGMLGIARVKEAGFDACHFNLHKTFSSPHGSFGPGCAAFGVTQDLAKFLPVPVVTFDGEHYHLDYDRPESIGKVREFFGNIPVVLRAYAWIMSMGAEGLLEASQVSVLNNNYLSKKLLKIPGVSLYYDQENFRMELTRFSWEKLKAGNRVWVRGCPEENDRLWFAGSLYEPPSLDRPGAIHARALRIVFKRGHRLFCGGAAENFRRSS